MSLQPLPPDAPEPAAPPADASPMMAQYLDIKARNAGYLLFYRMGDFYELFFDDAVRAAEALDIALTKRGKHAGGDIPMCGVPVVTAEVYLERLIRKGFRVAVCEQTEDPAEAKKRGSKSVVRREVVRLVTPGTLTEDSLLDARARNHLAALARAGGQLALAWAEMSEGGFRVATVAPETLAAELARIAPGELLASDALAADEAIGPVLRALGPRLTLQPAARFDSAAGERALKAVFGVAALDGFGAFGRADCAAAGAIVAYLELTQKGKLPALRPPLKDAPGATMALDPATRRNLELHETLSGARGGSLLSVIDRTVTAAGARELSERLAAPLTDAAAIRARLSAVAWLVSARPLRAALREVLTRTPDMARALGRITAGRGGPRDLGALRTGLAQSAALQDLLPRAGDPLDPLPEALFALRDALTSGDAAVSPFFSRLTRTLAADLPLFARDGGFVASGVDPALDEARALRDESRRVIAALEARYRADTGIGSLKIRHNQVLGYFVEATPATADRLFQAPHAATFIHRQTVGGGAVRFTTGDLAELASKIEQAGARALALELGLFEALVKEAAQCAAALQARAAALAELDVHAALAELAETERWTQPDVDASAAFSIAGGRHPVVEAALASGGGGPFVANDCDLSPDGPGRLWLVTGPNMAGKSTFLRQNALIAILAQMGSFVPAAAARIGVVDRLYSRVGAADDLARGRSTFMVEMVETAAILNGAGPKALVILDEIGRGTATYDGLSIAWAAVEHLHEANRCRALFATHYHELTALAGKLPALAPVTMRVKEWQGEVIFLHEVAPGAADRSYGIAVAKLAGLPPAVIARAGAVLRALEQGGARKPLTLVDDLPLFSAARPAAPAGPAAAPPAPPALEAALRDVNPDELSPKQALELVYRLRGLLP